MSASETPAAEGRPTDQAEDRKVLREMKEKSDHLDHVVGEARDAVREAQAAQKVGTDGADGTDRTERSGGQAESGVTGGDTEGPSGGDEDDVASTSTNDQPDADIRKSQEAE